MSCPNCQQELELKNIGNQSVLHCKNCGCSFFDENGINRISLHEAQELSLNKNTDEVSGAAKPCPKDQTPLAPITGSDAIPADVTLLRCNTCHGILAYPDDLVRFKQAQEVKVNYFKTWGLTLPSVRAVVVVSFTALAFLSIFTTFQTYVNKSARQTEAQDVIKKINISQSNQYLFISFRSESPLTSEIVFTDKRQGTTTRKIISKDFSTIHYLVTADIDLDGEIYFQIICRDQNGKEIKTVLKQLEIQ